LWIHVQIQHEEGDREEPVEVRMVDVAVAEDVVEEVADGALTT
jgi:hypothetical protein